MSAAGPSEPNRDDDTDGGFVERDPAGRYGRYDEVLGRGAFKTVYKAFDELDGIEVAWNQVKRVADVLRNNDDLDRLYSEVHLLQTLKHKNIIKFFSSWLDPNKDNINFITEVFTSGNLRQYRNKHKYVDVRALKNWSRQILSGLLYLHSHDPPVIHRDLKCDNLFVNGNQGEVKIGDLGLAAILRQAHSAHSVIGTPEFMAPELYEEEYNELVDIYAFGMCLLELVTFEYPYSECTNAAQIYRKVTKGVKPASLGKVKDPSVKQFIEKCIADVSERLSARELLMDPFLQLVAEDGSFQLVAENGSLVNSLWPNPYHADNIDHPNACTENSYHETSLNGGEFTVEGERQDINTVLLKLHFAASKDEVHNIGFPFDIEDDTPISVATEMVTELDLTEHDVTEVAAKIEAKIRALVPEWTHGDDDDDDNDDNDDDDYQLTGQGNHSTEAEDELSSLRNESNLPSDGLVLEQLSSGLIYRSDSPKGTTCNSPSRLFHSKVPPEVNSHINDEFAGENLENVESTSKNDHHSAYYSPDTCSVNLQSESLHVTSHDDVNLKSIPSSSSESSNSSPYMVSDNDKEPLVSVQSANDRARAVFDQYNADVCLQNIPQENELEGLQSITEDLKRISVEQQVVKAENASKHDDNSGLLPYTAPLFNQKNEPLQISKYGKVRLNTNPSSSFESPSSSLKYIVNQNDREISVSFQSAIHQSRAIADQFCSDNGCLCKGSSDNEHERVQSITEKLKLLLVEQQAELDELKKKHHMAISKILKELPPEFCERTLMYVPPESS